MINIVLISFHLNHRFEVEIWDLLCSHSHFSFD